MPPKGKKAAARKKAAALEKLPDNKSDAHEAIDLPWKLAMMPGSKREVEVLRQNFRSQIYQLWAAILFKKEPDKFSHNAIIKSSLTGPHHISRLDKEHYSTLRIFINALIFGEPHYGNVTKLAGTMRKWFADFNEAIEEVPDVGLRKTVQEYLDSDKWFMSILKEVGIRSADTLPTEPTPSTVPMPEAESELYIPTPSETPAKPRKEDDSKAKKENPQDYFIDALIAEIQGQKAEVYLPLYKKAAQLGYSEEPEKLPVSDQKEKSKATYTAKEGRDYMVFSSIAIMNWGNPALMDILFQYSKKMADKGHLKAIYNLMSLYSFGNGKDKAQLDIWCKKYLELGGGEVDELEERAKMGIDSAKLSLSKHYFQKRDHDKYLEWQLESVFSGLVKPCQELAADFYNMGHFIGKLFKKAERGSEEREKYFCFSVRFYVISAIFGDQDSIEILKKLSYKDLQLADVNKLLAISQKDSENITKNKKLHKLIRDQIDDLLKDDWCKNLFSAVLISFSYHEQETEKPDFNNKQQFSSTYKSLSQKIYAIKEKPSDKIIQICGQLCKQLLKYVLNNPADFSTEEYNQKISHLIKLFAFNTNPDLSILTTSKYVESASVSSLKSSTQEKVH